METVEINQEVMTPFGNARIVSIDQDSKSVRVKHLHAKTPITDFYFSQLSPVGIGNHTPGPWRYKSNGIIDNCSLIDASHVFYGKIIATVNIDSNHEEIGTANLKLITASPDMLKALLLEDCFPITNTKESIKAEDLAESLGWKRDMPLVNFAAQFRKAAIKKATE